MLNFYTHRSFSCSVKVFICIFLILGGFVAAESRTKRKSVYNNMDVVIEDIKILWDIYKEVKEMGTFPNEHFIKRQFHVGDEDDTNQDIHVFVLIQEIDSKEKMTIQVTYLKTRDYPAVGIPVRIKNIQCSIRKDDLKIVSSDYSKKEMNVFLKELKHSISDKKRLLGLIKKD